MERALAEPNYEPQPDLPQYIYASPTDANYRTNQVLLEPSATDVFFERMANIGKGCWKGKFCISSSN
jgi:hypothetical protein